MSENAPTIEVQRKGDVTQANLLLSEILDEITIAEFSDAINALVQENKPIRLLLNFVQVEHLSSSALGTLIRVEKTIKQHEGDFALCGIQETLFTVFKITKLDEVFTIYKDVEDALENF